MNFEFSFLGAQEGLECMNVTMGALAIEGIKDSFDGALPRMSALCGVYSWITTVKYGDGVV